MSEVGRLRGQLAVLESRRQAHLANAERYEQIAAQSRAMRDLPADPTRMYEHQREMDARAQRATGDAAAARQQAELTLNEVRGIERELSYRVRQER